MAEATRPTPVIRHPGGVREPDTVAVEEPMELRIEGRPLLVTMRTPGDDEELAAGLLYTEGVIDGPDDLTAMAKIHDPRQPRDNTMDVRLAAGVDADAERFASARRDLYASSACGVCGKATVEQVMRRVPALPARRRVDPALLMTLPALMRPHQSAFEATGGIHAAALFSFDGTLEVLREDIGRHNAVDKVLGWRLLADRVPVDDRVLVVSGRAGFELVQKAAIAGVPAMASVGAASSLAVELAREVGMQLVGFLKHDRLNEYC